MITKKVSFIRVLISIALISVLIEGVSFAANHDNAHIKNLQHFVDAGKLPPGIQKNIMEEGQAGVLVILDDSDVQELSRQMREGRKLRFDDKGIIDEKARHYKNKKTAVLSRMPAGSSAVLQDYENFPVVYLEVDEQGLSALLRMTEVSSIGENQTVLPHLTESLALINAPEVHIAGATGSGTSVAVLDTGVDYTRAAFGNCTAPGDPLPCRVSYETCFATGGCWTNDDHGTNVSGIVLGVAPDARIVSLDVFKSDGTAEDSDILTALNWVISNHATYDIVAVNMSFGGGRYYAPCAVDSLKSAIISLKNAGITSAVSSGNNAYTDSISHPACVAEAVSVGAVYDANVGTRSWCLNSSCSQTCTDTPTAADKVACFSNSASFLTMLAPGAIISAAGIGMAGTSQAAPHVAGAVAVMKGQNNALTVDEVISGLTATGNPVTDSRNSLTKPRVDLYGLVSITNPIIYASPSSFAFLGAQGGLNPADMTLSITNTGSGTLGWSVSDNVGWLSLAPLTGTAPASTTLSADTTGLSEGSYTATVTITATDALNTPMTIPVTLEIRNAAYPEDFESGDLSGFEWVTGGDSPWAVQGAMTHTGAFTAQSGLITDGQSSMLEVTMNVTAPGDISFWYRVSSEPRWDRLDFLIDGSLKKWDGYSGETGWAQAKFPVTAGLHTFRWEYSKDPSVSAGSDAAWLDDIFFPPHTPRPAVNFDASPVSGDAPLAVSFTDLSGNNPTSWEWNFGNGETDTVQNPLQNYKTPGIYTVSLSATNIAGTGSLTKTDYITVSACSNQPVRIGGAIPVSYATIPDAYSAIAEGDTIEAHAVDFTGALDFNRAVGFTLKGGFGCAFAANPVRTTLLGSLTISSGTATVENIVIR